MTDGDIYLLHYNDETNFDIDNINMEGKDLVEAFQDDLVEAKSYFIILSPDAAGSQNEGDIFSEIILVEAEEKLTQESPTTSTHDIISKKEIVEQSRKAIEEHCKTYCPKCKEKEPVILRKSKCSTCQARLTYSCEKCQKSYVSYTELQCHIRLKDIGLPYELGRPKDCYKCSCSKCGQTFMWVQSLRKHERICGIESRFKCTRCPYKATYKHLLLNHLLTHGENAEIGGPCPKCGKIYTNKKALQRHQSNNCDQQKLLQCAHCDKMLSRKDRLIKHLRLCKLPTESVPCKKKCGLYFNNYYKMKVHLKKCVKG